MRQLFYSEKRRAGKLSARTPENRMERSSSGFVKHIPAERKTRNLYFFDLTLLQFECNLRIVTKELTRNEFFI